MNWFKKKRIYLDYAAATPADVRLKLESTGALPACGAACEEVALGSLTTFDDVFHSLCMPLSGFTAGGVDLSQFETLVITALDINGSYSFYVDNLRFEQ